MDLSFTSELVHSMLDATGSMQRLTDELERISLHSFSGQPSQEYNDWMKEEEMVSGIDDSASESQSRASQVSSKFDSAFGSQTDSESVHEHLLMNPLALNSSPTHSRGYQRTNHDSHRTRHHGSFHRKQKHRKHQTIHHCDDTTPTPHFISQSHQQASIPLSQSMRLPAIPQAVNRLRREGSTRSTSSTDSGGSSRILTLGLSREDLREISHRPHQPSPILRRYLQTSPEKESYQASTKQNESKHPNVVYVTAEVHDSDTDINSTSNTSTPIVATKFHSQPVTSFVQQTERSDEPEIVVIESNKEQESTKSDTLQANVPDNTHYQRSHQASHLLPKRYVNSTKPTARRNPPKRSASLLHRLRKRSRSFKTTLEKRPKRRVPVRRSLSDRITYQIKKGWIQYDEDLNFISTPSYPRPVGRMVDRKAGSVHIVQLYRPPSGKYGIYISQSGSRKGIFISRFADTNAAKFYSGLISPGDEIIKVNTHPVKDKSVDYVYDMLASLDSVVFTIIPITARPDW